MVKIKRSKPAAGPETCETYLKPTTIPPITPEIIRHQWYQTPLQFLNIVSGTKKHNQMRNWI
jgi:hypothetical protein